MTKWTEFPLRPQGQPWPGLNTRGGRLDPGSGQLEDGSFGAIINESDLLQKRKGLVRGLEERFTGVVCGLFRYTDSCGIEYLVVADQDGIKVRMPFSIPEYLGSDSLPFDDFNTLDTTRWSPTDVYEVFLGALQLNNSDDLTARNWVIASQLMQWFKASAATSYFVEVNYRLTASADQNAVSTVIKRASDGDTYLEAAVVAHDGTYKVFLYFVLNGVRNTLAESDLGGATLSDGFLRISYSALTRTASARVIPSGGSTVTISGTLNEADAAALGQFSAIGLSRNDVGADPQIESVSGGLV